MRIIFLTLVFILAAVAAPAQGPELDRLFGITLGEPLPLSSKQVQGVGSPGFGLERFMLLYTPGYRPPFARHFATVDVKTKRVAATTGKTRKYPTTKAAWKAFEAEIEKLESEYGTGMRPGGGTLWKVVNQGRSLTLALNPDSRALSLTLADERRLRFGSPRK